MSLYETDSTELRNFKLFISQLPWIALLVNQEGIIIHSSVNSDIDISELNIASNVIKLSTVYPEYWDVLQKKKIQGGNNTGVLIQRNTTHGIKIERLFLIPYHDITCLIVCDETEHQQNETKNLQTIRLASLGFMLAGTCHEVSNPLTAIRSMVQILKSEILESLPELTDQIKLIDNNIAKLLNMLSKLNSFSRSKALPMQKFNAVSLFNDVINLIHHHELGENLKVELKVEKDLDITCRIEELHQVLFNIFLNAAQAMKGDGKLMINAKTNSEMINITISDTGPGIKKEYLDKIFNPFFSDKSNVPSCSGLGLSISDQIIREHGGKIIARNNETGGASITINLPIEQISYVE